MADALNQNEINALIDAYKSTGDSAVAEDEPDKRIRLYDFARPDKFSKEHLRALNMIHAKHGASLGGAMSAMLRTGTQVELLALDQLTYREYCASVPENTLFVEASREPLATTAIFEFNPHLASLCMDLITGSSSMDTDVSREFSELDKAVITPIVNQALRKYAEAWSACVELTPKIQSMMSDSSTHQILLPTESVLVCGYEVTIGDVGSMMSICIPTSAVEAVVPKLSIGRSLDASGKHLEEVTDDLKKSFEEVSVKCRAVLGETSLDLGEVVQLEVGDFIKLPTKANGQVTMYVENVPAFAGNLGLAGKSMAMRIQKSLEELDFAA